MAQKANSANNQVRSTSKKNERNDCIYLKQTFPAEISEQQSMHKKIIMTSSELEFEKFTIQDFGVLSEFSEYNNQSETGSSHFDPLSKNVYNEPLLCKSAEEYVCMYCGQEIKSLHYLKYKQNLIKRNGFMHEECSTSKNTIYQLYDNRQLPEQSVIKDRNDEFLNRSFLLKQKLQIKHFHASLKITHPCTNLTYVTIDKKVEFANNQVIINLKSKHKISYQPNIVAVPLKDFRCVVILELATIEVKYDFLVNLSDWQGKNSFIACSKNTILEGEIICKAQQKAAIKNQMNYKYQNTDRQCPMVIINKIKFDLSDHIIRKVAYFMSAKNQLENKQYTVNSGYQTGTSISNDSPFTSPNHNLFPVQSFDIYNQYQNYYYPNYQYPYQSYKGNTNEYEDDFKLIYQWINNNQIVSQSRTNFGSRQIQKFLKKADQSQISFLIESILNDLPQIIVDQYGNYTFQQLVNVSNPENKYKILAQIVEDIPKIARIKQGTHALQNLVSHITTEQEYLFIKEGIKNDLLNLSIDLNGNHFIQKVIATINPENIQFICKDIADKLPSYVRDPNGALVVKSLIQKNFADHLHQRLRISILKNLQQIIQDPYGNYIVHEAYKIYKQSKLIEVTQKILDKFILFSSQKYSSNVVISCIQQYCSKQFCVTAENNLLKTKKYDEMMKTTSSQHIIKLLVSLSENKMFIEDAKKVFSQQKFLKIQLIDIVESTVEKKQAKTAKFHNANNFQQALNPDNKLDGFIKKAQKKVMGSMTPTANTNQFKFGGKSKRS